MRLSKLVILPILSGCAAYCHSFTCRSIRQQRRTFLQHTANTDQILEYDVNDDSSARSVFGTKEYWDELYQGRGDFPADEYQWYFGLTDYYGYVNAHVPNKRADILIPGIGNDPVLLDLLQKGYTKLTGTDYSDHAIERQEDILSYSRDNVDEVVLQQMDARAMPSEWEDKFDAVVEKGCFDAIYLSGDGNVEAAVQEIERVLKPGGILISVSGVVPTKLRKEILKDWQWIRDGSDDLQAGCFVLQKR